MTKERVHGIVLALAMVVASHVSSWIWSPSNNIIYRALCAEGRLCGPMQGRVPMLPNIPAEALVIAQLLPDGGIRMGPALCVLVAFT